MPRIARTAAPLLLLAVLLSAPRTESAAGAQPYARAYRLPRRLRPLREDLRAVLHRERTCGIRPAPAGEDAVATNPPDPQAPPPGALLAPPPGHRPRGAVPLGLAVADRAFDTIQDTGRFPSDSAIAVGPEHVVTAANAHLKVQRLDGTPLFFAALSSFFPSEPTGFLFDPRLCYDEAAGRFLLAAVARSLVGVSNCVLAVSATADPTGEWYKYVIPIAGPFLPGTEWADFPSLGYDAQAVYLAVNLFSFSGDTFGGNLTMIFDRAELLAGAPASPVMLEDLVRPPGAPAFTLKPVEWLGTPPAGERGLMLCHVPPGGLALFRISDPLGRAGPPRVSVEHLSGPLFALAGDAPQAGSAPPLNTVDYRLHKTMVRDGVLWTCQTVSASGSDGGPAEVLVYRVDPAVPPAVLSVDTLSDPTMHYFDPAVMPDVLGNAIAVFFGSSPGSFVSLYASRRDAARQEFETPTLIAGGSSAYVETDAKNRNRWGDYTDAAIDPDSGGTRVWIHGQLPETRTTWRMRAARIPSGGYTLRFPNGGERLEAGSTPRVTWSSAGTAGDVTLELSRDGGRTFKALAPRAPDTGSLALRLPGPETGAAVMRVRSFDRPEIRDASDRPFSVVPPTLPAAPRRLRARAQSSSSILLTWQDRSGNEEGFRVEARPPGGSFGEIGSAAPDAVSFTAGSLAPGQRYAFRVRAFNAAGSSGYSNTARARTRRR